MGVTLDAVITPVGGGGICAATCLAAHALQPGLRVFGSEPVEADDAAQSLSTGRYRAQTAFPDSICDGLLGTVGQLPWKVMQHHLESIVTVDDNEVKDAMRLLYERCKIVAEPSSSAALASVLSKHFPLPKGAKVGVIITGGNVNLEKLPFRD